jgi:sugar/nucleoside kinase (ribokinase family)
MAQSKTTPTKITTLGAATQDVFLLGSALKAKRDVRTHTFVEQFPLGAKLELDKVIFSTGGGATNAAVTFARYGFHASLMGKVADDPAGQNVVQAMEADNVKTDTLACDLDGTTGYSTLLLAPRGERTILVYRGVSRNLEAGDFDHFAKLKTDWLYITSLGGNFPLLESVVEYARTRDIKLAINPGSGELKQPERFRELLSGVSVLSLNKEEAQKVFEGQTPGKLAREAAEWCATVLITNGPKGSCASDGRHVYKAGMYQDVAVLDRTGAGDAMTSGFVAKVASGESIEQALVYGSANSTSVVQQVGAKAGILSADASIQDMNITKTAIGEQVHA